MSDLVEQLLNGLKSGVEMIQAVAPGLSADKMVDDVVQEGKRHIKQGANEMASALFHGSAFVLYGSGQYLPSSSHPKGMEGPAPEQEPVENIRPELEQGRGR